MNRNKIVHEFSTPRAPQQNGRTERQIRTIVEIARMLLAAANLPLSLWAESSRTAAIIRNRIPLDRLNGKTPWEIFTGEKPDVSFLHIYGSDAYSHIEDQIRGKFDKKSKKLVFVGYEPGSKAYRLWERDTKNVYVRCNVKIVEPCPMAVVEFIDEDEDAEQPETEPEEQEEDLPDNISSLNKDKPIANRTRSKQKVKQEEEESIASHTRSKVQNTAIGSCLLTEINVPENYDEAIKSADSDQWKRAMYEELDSLNRNYTWQLVELPEGHRAIRNKWIYRIKTKPNGNVDRYKARLVVKDCSQKPGIEFSETYSPVTRYDSIRILIAVVTYKNYETIQFDIKTVFLYGDLNEELYMLQPEGFDDGSGKVCKLL